MHESTSTLVGATVHAIDGAKVGTVESVVRGGPSTTDEWLRVKTGLLRTRHVLVPTAGMTMSGEVVTVPYAKERITKSPEVEDAAVAEQEARLFSYYGLDEQALVASGDGSRMR